MLSFTSKSTFIKKSFLRSLMIALSKTSARPSPAGLYVVVCVNILGFSCHLYWTIKGSRLNSSVHPADCARAAGPSVAHIDAKWASAQMWVTICDLHCPLGDGCTPATGSTHDPTRNNVSSNLVKIWAQLDWNFHLN